MTEPRRIILKVLAVVAFVAAGAFILAVIGRAEAHSWFSWACCSDKDCQQVSFGEIERRDDGWFIVPTGELIKFTDPEIKRSQDPLMYRCVKPSGMTRCLYVPEPGG